MLRKCPAVFLLAFVVAGIMGADLLRPPAELMMLCALTGAAIGVWLAPRNEALAGLLLAFSLGFFASGHFALRHYDFGPSHLSERLPEQRRMQFFGRVDDWPLFKSWGTEIRVALDSIQIDDAVEGVSGAVLIKLSDTTTAVQYGDRLAFEGSLYRTQEGSWPGGFDYSRYLNLKGVHGIVYFSNLADVSIDRSGRSLLYTAVDNLRSWITRSFHAFLTPQAAALASGFLIGETRDIPPEVYQWFRDSGTLHLLAVSGSNVALVVLFFVFVLRPIGLPRRLRSLVLLVLILIFALVCYAEPSVVRASIMAALVIVASIIERRYDLNQIIAVTALTVLLYDPGQLYSVGFQLSFVTAWGLIITVPRFDEIFKRYRREVWYYWVLMPLMVTLTAQFFAGPLLAYYFNSIPVVAPVANLVVVPLVSACVVGCMTLLTVAAIWPPAAAVVGFLLDWLLRAVLHTVTWFGSEGVPTAQIHGISGFGVILLLGLIALGAFSLRSYRARRLLAMALAVIVNVLLVQAVIESLRSTPRHQFCVFRVAEGVAVVSRSGRSESADLYLGGIHDTHYPIDTRILQPALHWLDIDRLDRLLVNQTDYGALGDILRLAMHFETDSVVVPPSLRASVIDNNRLRKLGWDESRLKPVAWEGDVSDSCGWGICPTRRGILFRAAGLSLRVGDRHGRPIRRHADSLGLILVNTSRFSPNRHFSDSGLGERIRAEFSLFGAYGGTRPGFDQEGRSVYSLDFAGGYLISIYDDPSEPLEIRRLD